MINDGLTSEPVEASRKPSPRQRVAEEIGQLKAGELPPPFCPVGLPEHGKPISWSEQAEGAKLYLLETKVNWTGIDPQQHSAILHMEVEVHAMQPLMVQAIMANAQMDHVEGLTATARAAKPEPEHDGNVTDERQNLVRSTFEKMREIKYGAFREEYFDAHASVQKYPDPEIREQFMRSFWEKDFEKHFSRYEQETATATVGSLKDHDKTLDRMVASHGQCAWELIVDTPEIIRVHQRRDFLATSPQERTHNDRLTEAAKRGSNRPKDRTPDR